MAAEKKAFEVKANVNSVEIAVGERLVRVEAGTPYETSDIDEIRALEDNPSVKTAESPKKGGSD